MEQDHLIQKWLSGEMTAEEKRAFQEMEDASFLEGIVEDAKVFKASDFSKVASFEDFKRTLQKKETPVRKLDWLRPVLKVAAVVAISIGVFYFIPRNNEITEQTLAAEKTTIELPDASQVVLNAGSKVQYDEKDWANNRSIKLEGEAFFDVAKGAKFDVVTSAGTVTVLGTEFNVKQRGDLFEVACFEGTVRVTIGENIHILKVGDHVNYVAGEITTGKHINESPSWTQNMSQFARIPLSEVFAELERQYNIKVITESVDVNQLFTGGFVQNDLESALMGISTPLDLNYEILKPDTVRFSTGEN